MAVRGPDGACEIIGFAQAELVGDNIWRLSRLLRGQGGQEHLATREVAAGALAVMLDDALVPLGAGALGLTRTYAVGPASRDYADAAYVRVSSTPGPLALKPYAPDRVRARRGPEGVTISFIRRTRIDGDNWECLDIPLGESAESYVVEILSGDAVKRSLSIDTPEALYARTDEIADFTAPQTHLSLRIAQVSAFVGRGFALQADVPIL